MTASGPRPPRGTAPARKPLTVLVVDDSAVVRQALTAILTQGGPINVVTAHDPIIAMSKLAVRRPDVILLDLEMPRMDGISFLRKLMSEDPLPVVVCSSLAGRGTEAAFLAMSEGAVDIIAKPSLGVKDFLAESSILILDTVYAAAAARIRGRRTSPPAGGPAAHPRPAPGALTRTTDRVIAIGASTGGTEALREILQGMPVDAPGIVIVQHMPEYFTRAFAKRLDELCAIEVREAADGDRVLQGRALIAPGNKHLRLRRSGAHYMVEVAEGPLVSRHRPSVDVLFESVAESAGANAAAALLTGMGDDGAHGLLKLRTAGAHTIAQDEATSVVFGMPKEAITLGAVQQVLPLPSIARALLRGATG